MKSSSQVKITDVDPPFSLLVTGAIVDIPVDRLEHPLDSPGLESMPTFQGTPVEHDLRDIPFPYDHLVGIPLTAGDGEFQFIVFDVSCFPSVLKHFERAKMDQK